MKRKINLPAICLIVISALTIGLAHGQESDLSPELKKKLEDSEPIEVKKLLLERRDTLKKIVELSKQRLEAGAVVEGDYFEFGRAFDMYVEAELEIGLNGKDRIKLMKDRAAMHRKFEGRYEQMRKGGIVGRSDYLKVKSVRQKAEIELLREQAKQEKATEK